MSADASQSDIDGAPAARLASECGDVVLQVRRESGLSGRALGDEADRVAQAYSADALSSLRPGDALLSEEAPDDLARLRARRVWIIDPLDGTREFSEGRGDWAVHVALWQDGDLTAGAVAVPCQGRVLSTHEPQRVPERSDGPLRVAVSRTRPPREAQWLVQRIGAHLVPMGSAGCKSAAVVLGQVDAYVHAGGQDEWDSAAPVAVARATGLHTTRIDGTQLRYNRPDPALPDLVIARPDVAAAILEVTTVA